MSETIFVTGATGFLGRSLVAKLKADGATVTAIGSKEADLTEQHSLDKFSKQKFDFIYHLAAWTQAGDFCLTHKGEQWLINQQINTTVLTWWHRAQPQAKFISMGTSCSYPVDMPLKEENYLCGTPIEELYTYAMTKRMLLVGQRSLREQFGLRYITVVPSTLYGPGYHAKGKQLHFIFDLIRKILRSKKYGDKVVLWGDGHQKRELVFIDDFISTLLALNRTLENDLINIGAGEEHTIREYAELICSIVGVDPKSIQYDTARYVGARSKVLDVQKLERVIPNRQRTPLIEGLKKTIEWMSGEESLLFESK